MYVVIDCIKALSDIFQVDYKNITGNKNHFKKVEFSFPNYETEIVPVVVEDGEFFSYYRSLSSVHVSNTSSVPGFFKKGVFHSSLYLLHKGAFDNRTVMRVLTSDNKEFTLRVHLKAFKNHLKEWIKLLPKMKMNALNLDKKYVEDFVNANIKTIDEFNNDWISYVKNLELQYKRRYRQSYYEDDDTSFFSEFFIKVYKTKFLNNEMQNTLENYIKQLKEELLYFHQKIQTM